MSLKKENLFYRSPKIENGKATYEYFKILKGYQIVDHVTDLRGIAGARCKKCIKEKVSEEIAPVNNFINKEYKYIDGFKLVPFGKMIRGDAIITEDEMCEEIIYVDRKPE